MAKNTQPATPAANPVLAAAVVAATTPAPALAAAPVVVNPIDQLIHEAGIAGGTMVDKTREAAKLAAAELDASIADVAARIKAVVDKHSIAFTKCGTNAHNIKALFSDTLWLLAVPAATVENQIKVAGAPKGQKTIEQVAAVDAVELSKDKIRECAKQVREQTGNSTARTGRTPAQTTTVVSTAKQAETSSVNTWFDTLAVKIADPGEFAKIVAVLELAGYSVTKKNVKMVPASKAENAPAPALAAQLAAAKPADKILAAAAN